MIPPNKAWAAVVVLLFLMPRPAVTQPADETARGTFRFLPKGVVVAPLVASFQEPRVGVRKEIGSPRLKLDIGSTVDLAGYDASGDSSRFRLGVDFFTYALTTSAQGLRLQVDAVDGYFGGHLAWVLSLPESRIGVRLRLLHLSAHFLDGHLATGGGWKDDRKPIPFTRDFGELTFLWARSAPSWRVMLYSGVSYATLVRPVTIRRVATLHGLEFHTSGLTGQVLGRAFNLYAADHFTLTGVPSYIGTNNFEAGVKMGDWEGTGVRLYLTHYNGLDIFSQYYDVRRTLWGVGFAIDFW